MRTPRASSLGTRHLVEGSEVEVTLCPDGPALVRGATVVRDEAGEPHEVTRPIVAVCLCGKTQRAPWCDATHKVIPKPGGQKPSQG